MKALMVNGSPHRRGRMHAALEQLEKFLRHQQMIQVNSRYWPMVHGNVPEEVMRDGEGVQVMQTVGRNLAFTVKCLAAGRAAGAGAAPSIRRGLPQCSRVR